MKAHPVARILADERRTRGLSAGDVAERAGYSLDHLMKMECGQRLPSFATLTAWADALGYEITLKAK